jgi:signal recognition particle subunit SRP19
MVWFQIFIFITIVLIVKIISINLVTRDDNKIVLWPEYFDKSLTKNAGRRVPQKLAVSSPTVDDIAKAAKRLKMKPKIENNKAYPGRWWRKSGRVLVRADEKKTKVIRRVATVIKKYRKQ